MHSATILVINCGSSSIKFSLIEQHNGQCHISGLAERLDSEQAQLVIKQQDQRQTQALPDADHHQAMQAIVQLLEERIDVTTILAVGHRVVHGGETFSAACLIDDAVLQGIEACIPLAPLHNPANLLGIRAAQAAFSQLPHVAVFDTAFHQSLPPKAYLYPVPYTWYREQQVRRYGFHGSSHHYVSQQAALRLGHSQDQGHFIIAHLGNGCSVSAVKHGQSIDTSMGLTPLEGLVMGTRCGDIDPSIPHYMANNSPLSDAEIYQQLNKHSGLLGLSELSNDMRTLYDAAQAGHSQASLAIELFCYRLAKYIGGYAVALGHLDALVFTGGIGENAAGIRAQVMEQLSILGFQLDADRNLIHGQQSQGLIATDSSRPALVIATNEEGMIAQQTLDLVQPATTE